MTDHRLIKRVEKLPQHFHDAEAVLLSLGVDDFLFHGGAIRDHLLGIQHKDIDVNAFLPEAEGFWSGVYECVFQTPAISRFPKASFFKPKTLCELFQEKGLEFKSVGRNKDRISMRFQFQGSRGKTEEIDLCLRDHDHLWFEDHDYDASMNGLLMDRNGHIYGPPEAEADLALRTYRIQPRHGVMHACGSLQRFPEMKRRIQGLTLAMDEGCTGLQKAWVGMRQYSSLPDKALSALKAYRIRVVELNL